VKDWTMPRNVPASLAAALVAVATASVAHANAGQPKERIFYRHILDKGDLTCPDGTTRMVREVNDPEVNDRQVSDALEEACFTEFGVRHGYSLVWQQSGEQWATLGQYDRGRKTGRWLHFDAEGLEMAVSYYEKGRLRRHRDFRTTEDGELRSE
jgi:hypothetical protein